jgi:hypothetical protein
MGLATFHLDAVIPDGKGKFVRSQDPEASMWEQCGGDMSFLNDQTERGLVADCPYLWFVARAGDYEDNPKRDEGYDDSYDDAGYYGDEDEGERDEDEVATFRGGEDPAEILELLDGLERALVKHGSTPPVMTMFYWNKPDGQRGESSIVIGTLDGQECRLYGGWESASLNFLNAKPARKSKPITGDRITLESNRGGSPEIEVHRTTLADYYLPTIADMRSVCKYAIKKKGLVRSYFAP